MVEFPGQSSTKNRKNVVLVFADGGARGNPGPAAIGIIVLDSNHHVLEEFKERIGVATNNVAEYTALGKALQLASRYTRGEVQVFMDSEVVVRQMKGSYQIKAPHLLPLYKTVCDREKKFDRVVYRNVPRSNPFQAQADRLVNEALDGT